MFTLIVKSETSAQPKTIHIESQAYLKMVMKQYNGYQYKLYFYETNVLVSKTMLDRMMGKRPSIAAKYLDI